MRISIFCAFFSSFFFYCACVYCICRGGRKTWPSLVSPFAIVNFIFIGFLIGRAVQWHMNAQTKWNNSIPLQLMALLALCVYECTPSRATDPSIYTNNNIDNLYGAHIIIGSYDDASKIASTFDCCAIKCEWDAAYENETLKRFAFENTHHRRFADTA